MGRARSVGRRVALVVALGLVMTGGAAAGKKQRTPRPRKAVPTVTTPPTNPVTITQLGQWQGADYGRRLGFAPDGRRWAAAVDGAATVFLDAQVERHLAPGAHAADVGFSADGARLHVGPFTYDATTGQAKDTGGWADAMAAELEDASSASFAPDGAVVSGDGEQVVFAVRVVPSRRPRATPTKLPGARLLLLRARSFEVVAVLRDGGATWDALAIDATHIAGASGHEIVVWDRATHARRAVLKKQMGVLGGLAFSPDGTLLATVSAGRDHEIVLWDTATWQEVRSWSGDGAGVTAVAFHPTQPVLLTGGYDHQVKLWSLADGTLLETQGGPGRVRGLAIAPTGDRLAVATELPSSPTVTLYALK